MDNLSFNQQINQIAQTLAQGSFDNVMSYMASPIQREAAPAIPSAQQTYESIRYLKALNPPLIKRMLRSYSINPRSRARLRELRTQLQQQASERQQGVENRQQASERQQAVIQQQAVLPNPETQGFLTYSGGIQGRFYFRRMEFAFGPKFECNFPFKNPNTNINFSFIFDSTIIKGKGGLKGFLSLGRKTFKGTVTVGTDFSLSNLERSLFVQTNSPNSSNFGFQLKDDFSQDVHILAPSNVTENGRVVVSHNTKAEGVESEATLCVLPFKTVKKRVANRLKSRKSKQSEKSLQFVEAEAETKQAEGEAKSQNEQAEGKARPQKEQLQGEPCMQMERVQRVQVQIIQPPQVTPDLVRERKSAIFKLALFTALVCLFLFFIKKLKSFLETKRLK